MLKKLNIKRDHLLLAGSILLLLACYQLAFKRTVTAWQLNKQLKAEAAQENNLSYQPGYLERKNRNIDRILNNYQTDSLTFRTRTIEEISLLAAKHDVRLVELPADNPALHNNRFIMQRLEFEGGYSNLLRLINDLEKQQHSGIVRSVMMRKPRKIGTETNAPLIMTVYSTMAK